MDGAAWSLSQKRPAVSRRRSTSVRPSFSLMMRREDAMPTTVQDSRFRPGTLRTSHRTLWSSHPLELKFDASALRISTMQEQGKIQIPAGEMARDVSSKAKVSEGSDDEV